MTIFDRLSTSPDKKLKGDEGANHPQKPSSGLLLAIVVICGGVILTPIVAIRSGYNVITSAVFATGKMEWKFEGKPPLPPFQQPLEGKPALPPSRQP